MNNKDLESYQLELLKTNPAVISTIENPTDEMKWLLINNRSLYIQDIKEFTDEMMNEIVSLSLDFISKINIDWSKIKEESILKGIRNTKSTFYSGFLVYIYNNRPITNKIALELCLRNVLYYPDDKIKEQLFENDKFLIVENYLDKCINADPKNRIKKYLPKELPISEKQWQKLIDNNIYERMFFSREDATIDYRHGFIDFEKGKFMNYCSSDEKFMRTDDFLYWVENYYLKNEKDFKDDLVDYLKLLNSKQKVSILNTYGYLIQYIKKPGVTECTAAIKCDPFNIKYINKPTKKMIELAISLDKDVTKILEETKEVCEILKKKYKTRYPEAYYFVKFYENLADEDNLIKTTIVKGKNMEKFMEQSFTLSFGNLYDDEERKVSDCVEITPITKDEIKILKKFDVDDLETGFFNFDVDEE